MNDYILVYHNNKRIGISNDVDLQGCNNNECIPNPWGGIGSYGCGFEWEQAVIKGDFGNCHKIVIPFDDFEFLNDYILMLYS